MMTGLAVRYMLEVMMLVPAMVYALLPVRGHFRYRKAVVWGAGVFLAAAASVAGGFVCARTGISSTVVLLILIPFFYAAYAWCVRIQLGIRLFCFANAALLGNFCTYYTRLVSAPWEIDIDEEPFLVSSSMICFALTGLLLIMFFRTLWKKLPMLFELGMINRMWLYLAFTITGLTLMLLYMFPEKASVLMEGRVRDIALMLFWMFPAGLLVFYHMIWQAAMQVAKSASLTQENQLLQMEKKRHEEMDANIERIRMLRHDFRQHLLVIDQYAKDRNNEALREYIRQMDETMGTSVKSYCANRVADAVASHYNSLAEDKKIRVQWTLDLPEDLPFDKTDLCSVLGNLVENSIHAVEKLPEESRWIKVTSRLISRKMLGISVENPYRGTIKLGTDGLPVQTRSGHGIGLKSVSSVVSKYHGTLTLDTGSGIFGIDILLMG